jgi:hypothetical protein
MLVGRESLIKNGDVHEVRIVWCKARNILPRFGAVNKHGSIAVVERFHRTLKEIPLLITVPEHQPDFERDLGLVIDWYNEHRPHETLLGKTPNEVYYSRPPANERPRIEPRRRWPRGSPCAKPQVGIDGEPGNAILFELDCHNGRRHLPIFRIRPAASPTRLWGMLHHQSAQIDELMHLRFVCLKTDALFARSSI